MEGSFYMDTFSIGKCIAQLRKNKGWTQLELAEKLGVSDKAISKWESGNGLPEISMFPILAEVFGVTIDFLMTGKKEEPTFSLDDLDKTKRAIYLIERDDVDNFVKYGYVDPAILLSARVVGRNLTGNKENAKYRAAIIENQSVKIFGVLADSFWEKLKHKRYDYLYIQSCASAAGLVYDYLDDFVKLCALANKVELLSFIKFKSFAVGAGEQEQYCRGNNMYQISQNTLDFIFMDKRVPQEVIDFVSEYDQYEASHYRYSYGTITEVDSSNAIRMANNVLVSLYKSQRFDLLDAYIEAMKEEAQKSVISFDDNGYWSYRYFGNYGYIFATNGTTTGVCGKIVVITDLIYYAIIQKDKNMVAKLSKYNQFIKGLIDNFEDYRSKKPTVVVLSEKEIDEEIEKVERQNDYDSVMADDTISEYDRRRKLFAIGALKMYKTIEADDYDLFAQFPFEETKGLSIASVARTCNDIRFYVFAVNLGQKQENLDEALAEILKLDPERYDIIEILLSAGAKLKDNPEKTSILKQNIAILNKQKENATSTNIEINNYETKQSLMKAINEGRYEYAIVNLTIQLEKKLKAKYGKGAQLLDMIDLAFKDNAITELECSMLHNLRKSRNMIIHEGDDKGFYTPEIIKQWVAIVYSI